MNLDINISFDWLKQLGRPAPVRDWLIVLGFSGVFLVAGVAVAVYMFWGIQSGTIIAAAATAPTPPNPVSRAALKQVIDDYSVRAANYAAKSFPAYPVTDPRSTTKK